MPMERASLKHVQTRKREIHCSGRKCETELENKAKELNKERRRKEKKEKEEQKKLTKLCDCVNSTVIRHSSTMTSSQQGSSNSSFCPPFEPCASSLVISRYLGDTLQNGTANGHGTAYFHAGHVYQGEFLVCFSVVSPLFSLPISRDLLIVSVVWLVQNGELHGHGIFQWADGATYEGQFQHNFIQGLIHASQRFLACSL